MPKPSKPFVFKQFTVNQAGCAMKVGTDGVLLGAWATVTGATQILDVGTGTGLIALMLAQRSAATIDAIDIQESCAACATDNFQQSPWADRLTAHQTSLQNYQPNKQYDLIVSNPPYFANSQKAPNADRSLARHTDSLSLQELISCAKALLTETGSIALVLPFDALPELQSILIKEALFLNQLVKVKGMPDSPIKRILVSISKQKTTNISESELTIEIARHQYTQAYIALTNLYYLNM